MAADHKKADEEHRTLLFVDEAALYLLPMAVKTWAPVGETPIWHVPLTHDHLAAINGISPDGPVFLQVRPEAYDGEALIAFWRVLLRKIRGKLLIIGDGASIHRRKLLKAWLARGATKRLHWEQLPGYAPELNPDEGIWQYVKEVEFANVCCQNLPELQTELVRARERLRHKRDIIAGLLPRCGYSHLSFFGPSSIKSLSRRKRRQGVLRATLVAASAYLL